VFDDMTDIGENDGRMRRVLFVDDEQNVLDGLRNMLRRQRHVWDMVFARGAQAALVELEKAPFDVVVSDMRMPVTNGAALLQTVKQRYPSVARIILSGYVEHEAVVGALPVAHQFLSKPCDPETLRIVVERACELQALLTDEAIRSVVGRLDTLPSVPRTYWELRRVVDEPNVSAGDIASIVEKDPAMSVKILQLVNSAYFGLARRMTSVRHAVSYLGIELLKGLALTAHVFATMEASRVEGFSLDQLQRNSLLTAQLARQLPADSKRAEEAFTAALVHDIGKIVVAVVLPDRFSEIVRTARATGRSFHVVERELLGVTHAEIGAYLLGVWGLPFTIVEAVAYHHRPSSMVSSELCDVLAAVHVADALVDKDAAAPVDDKLDIAFLERAGLADRLPIWRTKAEGAMRKAAEASG
jgi:HD-like signal output (HDOD) protein